ncbi:hypothetical protein [Aquilutibacter rugosus]|uniref:hypothetical protein n=1 Tax=Aquilutibacter rugosus TaxID=3115820 RepID=UPI002F3E470C
MIASFATSPIGSTLLVQNNGLTVTGKNATVSAVRGNVLSTGGGVEFTFWGDGALNARIGLVAAGTSLESALTLAAWDLATGITYLGGSAGSNIGAATKGDTVGVKLSGTTVTYWKNGSQVGSQTVTAGTYAFAVSMSGADLFGAVNAGQWQMLNNVGVWETAVSAMDPVYLADMDYLADDLKRYEGVIEQSGLLIASAINFWPWGGDMGSGAVAQVNVYDPQGLYDGLIGGNLSGRPVKISIGDTVESATSLTRMKLDRVEAASDQMKTFHFRDAHDDLDKPVNRGVFLPSIPKLAWQTQPAIFGLAYSVPALLSNSDGSAAWLADGTVYASKVRDRGDLLEAGTWTQSGQQLNLSMPPVSPVTADVSSIAPDAPGTFKQIALDVFRRIGKRDYALTDLNALPTSGLGLYAGSAMTAANVLDTLLPSINASRWQDANGTLRFAQVVAPESKAIELPIDEADFLSDLIRVFDPAPNLTRRVAIQRNARPLTESEFVTDLTDVPMQTRVELMGSHRGQVYSSLPLPTAYAHADINPPMQSQLTSAADAQAMLDAVLSMYSVERYFFRCELPTSLNIQPGMIVAISYSRYSLVSKKCLVRSVESNPITGRQTVNLWG